MIALRASAHAAGGRIDVAWRLERPIPLAPDVPRVRLLRRSNGYPVDPSDGAVVLDLAEIVSSPEQSWARLERYQFRTANVPIPERSLETEVTLYFLAPQPSEPAAARLTFFDPAAQSSVEELVTDCSRVVRDATPSPGWASHETLQLFRTPGGGPEQPGGLLDIFERNDDPATANRVVWTPPAGPARTVEFDVLRHWKADRTEAAVLTFETRQLDSDAGDSWLTVAVEQNPDVGTEAWAIEVRDRDLEPLVDYYYGLFDTIAAEPCIARAVALATDDYDSPRRLFLRLPGAYQRADDPDPTRPTGAPGTLRRFLHPIGNTVDLGRSVAASVRSRQDVDAARLELLPRLARMIAWEPDLAAPSETQRRDVRVAPEIFAAVGTGPLARALINRVTQWPCRVKEFVHNVFLTNAPESARLWELGEIEHDGVTWGTPTQITVTTDIDARPALALDGAGAVWLFWQSDRGGQRELWRQRLDGIDAAPVLARAGAADDTPDSSAMDQDPAAVWDGTRVRLFWSSNRDGQWDIWARTFAGNPPEASDPERLTTYAGDNRSPAAVFVPGSSPRVWVFWSSQRRGPTNIWAQELDLNSGSWGAAERVTDSPLRDDRPSAAVDSSGRVWLFWTRDAGGRQTLCYRIHDGTSWVPIVEPNPLDVGHARDDAPVAVAWKGGIMLLWHSDHDGPWQIWGRFHDGSAWLDAARLDPDVTGNKEPAAVAVAPTKLRVVWRSQRRARWYRSRTLDFGDAAMLAEMGTIQDHAHYTYDTARGPGDWYARDTIGLYVIPDSMDAAHIQNAVIRAQSFLEPLRPLPVRYVWPTGEAVFEEHVDGGSWIGEAWEDEG